MARESIVSRTIETTEATVMVANLNTNTIEEVTLTLPRTYKNDEAILKAAARHLPTEQKVLTVKGSEVKSAIYGMTENDFLKYAQVMPDRKPNSTETANA